MSTRDIVFTVAIKGTAAEYRKLEAAWKAATQMFEHPRPKLRLIQGGKQ